MSDSVTEWLASLKRGKPEAARKLWERYFDQLTRLARQKLGMTPRRAADEEDVVIVAYASFCNGVAAGRFPLLDDRDDLWQVLLMLTERTAVDQRRRELAAKRGGGAVVGESAIAGPQRDTSGASGIAQLADHEPTPEFALQVAEELERRLAGLDPIDPQLRQIALAKLEAFTNEEIAMRLATSPRTVERQLSLIRQAWSKDRGK
jgi:RNA polymerase sigma factor (sigma-70 family)